MLDLTVSQVVCGFGFGDGGVEGSIVAEDRRRWSRLCLDDSEEARSNPMMWIAGVRVVKSALLGLVCISCGTNAIRYSACQTVWKCSLRIGCSNGCVQWCFSRRYKLTELEPHHWTLNCSCQGLSRGCLPYFAVSAPTLFTFTTKLTTSDSTYVHMSTLNNKVFFRLHINKCEAQRTSDFCLR